jgi:porin
MFFRFGVTDGNPNPFKYGYNAGIGGKGVVPGWPGDRVGIGWSRADFSRDLLPGLRRSLGLGLDHEDAWRCTTTRPSRPGFTSPRICRWWSRASGEPGLWKDIDSAGRLKNVGTAVVGGLRVFTRF